MTLTATLLLTWLAAGPSALVSRPPRVHAEPPRIVNIVRHKLKPGTAHNYEALETSIVAAYQQAHVQVFWIMLQSRTDATDIVYLNVANSLEEWDDFSARYRKAAKAHPELDKLSARLATFIDRSTSTLSTRHDDVVFSQSGIDLQRMRALRITVFKVTPGQEGRFMNAARGTSDRAAPWLLYEATNESTFILLTPLRTTSRLKKTPAIPHRLQALVKDGLSTPEDGIYAVRPQMSHPPKGWTLR